MPRTRAQAARGQRGWRAWHYGAALVALISLIWTCTPFRGLKTAGPVFPFPSKGPTSTVMQAVCNAQGHLQLLAQYPSDPVTVFSLLNLDPTSRPFSPTMFSRRAGGPWHQEAKELVERRYTELMELASWHDSRAREYDGDDDGDGYNYDDDKNNKKYKAALTAASQLLSNDGTRVFYIDMVLPILDHVVKGQPPRCVWPRIRALHRNMCAATWPTTGLLALARDGGSVSPADRDCFDEADARNWFGYYGRK